MIIPKYPAFNIYSHIACKTTALGPVCVATTVSKLPGWDAEIIDENNFRPPGPVDDSGAPDHAALQAARPADAVGFYGGLSCTVPRLLALAGHYRRAGVFTVGGGYHLAALPGEALAAGVEVVVKGEGEQAIGELLLARFTGGSLEAIPGIAFLKDGVIRSAPERPPIEDFDGLPLPDFGLLRYARMGVYPIGRVRGCGANCEFCAVKGRPRCASPERLLAQISWLAESRRAREFFIVDDQFAQDRAGTMRFCRLLAEYQRATGLRFFITAQIRLDCAHDADLLAAMRDAGIRNLAIGIESPIEEELRAMGKKLNVAEMVDLARKYHDYGFLVHGMFIFGYPMRGGSEFRMSAAERVRRFRTFIRRARLDTVQVLLPVPLPGTEFRARLERDGRVFPLADFGWEYYDGNFPLVVPDFPMTPAEMQESILTIMGRFYHFRRMPGVAVHTLRFPLAMLPLTDLKTRWRRWYRRWRNDVIGSVGYFIMRNWQKQFRNGAFRRKLALADRLAPKLTAPTPSR
ncbi:MAG TPA: radical SAM protein [Planctomycetota bacterium]|nr:radical SAM protein [Planctomycetota bacterium]